MWRVIRLIIRGQTTSPNDYNLVKGFERWMM